MARVQFELPDHFIFTTEVQIYVSHVNQAGHLDNAQLLTLVSEGRARFFRWLGYTEFDVEGVAIVVGDMLAQYKSEGFYGEVIRVEMVSADFNKYGFDLVFRLTEVSSGREVFVDKVHKKVVPRPEGFMQSLLAQAPELTID